MSLCVKSHLNLGAPVRSYKLFVSAINHFASKAVQTETAENICAFTGL